MQRPFAQVDVFTTTPYAGNPVAVVLDGTGCERRARCSGSRAGRTSPRRRSCCRRPRPRPTTSVRIFTPVLELPFAGTPDARHLPRLAHARRRRAQAERRDRAGVRRRADPGAPHGERARIRGATARALRAGRRGAGASASRPILGIERAEILDAEWVDNGPGWVAVMLASAEAVLAVTPALQRARPRRRRARIPRDRPRPSRCARSSPRTAWRSRTP